MDKTANRLLSSITSIVQTLTDSVDSLGGDCGVAGAECILALVECQQRANRAMDALRMVQGQAVDVQNGGKCR